MNIIKDTTENEMISMFLKGEFHSSRWEDSINKYLLELGIDDSIINEPNCNNSNENEIRRNILDSYRCYSSRKELFV